MKDAQDMAPAIHICNRQESTLWRPSRASLSGERSITSCQIERCVLGALGEFGTLTRHVALDVGEHGFEFWVGADRGEGRVEIAEVAPSAAAAALMPPAAAARANR
jgi:hypothetical protein